MNDLMTTRIKALISAELARYFPNYQETTSQNRAENVSISTVLSNNLEISQSFAINQAYCYRGDSSTNIRILVEFHRSRRIAVE